MRKFFNTVAEVPTCVAPVGRTTGVFSISGPVEHISCCMQRQDEKRFVWTKDAFLSRSAGEKRPGHLALAHSALTSFSLMSSQRRSCSICRSRSLMSPMVTHIGRAAHAHTGHTRRGVRARRPVCVSSPGDGAGRRDTPGLWEALRRLDGRRAVIRRHWRGRRTRKTKRNNSTTTREAKTRT